jgi:hypothetical protein
MLMVASVALLLGGYYWVTRPRSVELRAHPLPTRVNADHDIFDVVLSDLLVNKDFLRRRAVEPGVDLVLDARSQVGYPEDAESCDSSWAILGRNQVAPEILQNMNDRNPSGVEFLLTGYKPEDPTIVVRDLAADPDTSNFLTAYDLPSWVKVKLPGYSSDGGTAVLKFGFGPTPHGAGGVYLLRKLNGRWEVLDKEIYYYS